MQLVTEKTGQFVPFPHFSPSSGPFNKLNPLPASPSLERHEKVRENPIFWVENTINNREQKGKEIKLCKWGVNED
jgi:hypothetical protein